MVQITNEDIETIAYIAMYADSVGATEMFRTPSVKRFLTRISAHSKDVVFKAFVERLTRG